MESVADTGGLPRIPEHAHPVDAGELARIRAQATGVLGHVISTQERFVFTFRASSRPLCRDCRYLKQCHDIRCELDGGNFCLDHSLTVVRDLLFVSGRRRFVTAPSL